MRRLAAVVAVIALTGGCSVEDAIRMAFWEHSPEVQQQAIDVAWCESRHDPAAENGIHKGLFQLNLTYHGHRIHDGAWSNAFFNAVAAEALYEEQGWRPWACRP